jgi:alpha/beta superfamily hydrolase
MTVASFAVNDESAPQSVALLTSDGLTLEAQLAVPADPRAVIVLCHPHPAHGGTMTSLLTSELFRTLPIMGYATLRFNFRGVGKSQGVHDNGIAERNDIEAAVNFAYEKFPTKCLALSGWSFGGDTSLAVTNEHISLWIPCAPTLRIVPAEELGAAAGSDPRPKHLIVPEHDEFRDPQSAREATVNWRNTTVTDVAGADHFFVGRTNKAAELIDQFIVSFLAD